MPSLGADMEAGTLAEWLVAPGDTVKRGDIVAVVETQKGAIEIECFEAGEVRELLAEPGQELPVGAPLALILAKGETAPATVSPKPAPERPRENRDATAPRQDPLPVPEQQPPDPGPSAHQGAASPAARVFAQEHGIALSALKGSGPGGAVLLADVEAAAAARRPSKPASPMAEMRKAIAAAMTRSKTSIPHFYLSQTIDLHNADVFLSALNADRPPETRVLMGALFTRAVCHAAAKVPVLNGTFDEDGFHPAEQVNPGIAVALRGGGLVAPALIDALSLDLDGTMSGMRDLVTRARAGRLRGSEMTSATLTISSLGEGCGETMTGVIFPPQVALIGIGAPQRRPWVVEGEILPRTVVTVTVSADHRVCDGRQAARFLSELETRLQTPEAL